MAKITIVGDAMVVTSTKTLENIQTLEKYRPKALRLYETNDEGKREEVFTVGTTKGNGSINQYGASFASCTHDAAKLATITLPIPAGTADAKKIGVAITLLTKVEAQIDGALTEVAAEKAEVLGKITVA